MLKLVSKSSGIKLLEHSYPNIGKNDVLIETIGSCYSKGTEHSTAKNHQRSIIEKVIENQSKIVDLIQKKDFKTLFKKLNEQKTSTINLGYSASGKVLAIGESVRDFKIGDMVVSLGSSANHSQYSAVSNGLCIKIGNEVDPLQASSAAIASIALNSVLLANPLIGSKALVIGCGLIGQFIIQFLNISGVESTSVDIDYSKKEQSLLHGSNSFLSLEEFHQANISNEFENVFIVTPAIEKELWKLIGNNSKSNSNIIMVGAADLNCPREIFYKKQLNFISPHSYGPGRGLYDFEILGKDFPKFSQTWDLRSNVKTFIKLLCDKKVSTSFIDVFEIDNASTSSFKEVLENKKSFSTIFDWRNTKKINKAEIPEINKEITNEVVNYKNVVIYGFSNFAREAHIPELKRNNTLNLSGIFNRTPIESSIEKILDTKQLNLAENGTILISTNHGSHASTLIKYLEKGKFVIVDKPLCINTEELNTILKLDQKLGSKFICFMNRRYSKHTEILKEYISKAKGPFHLDCIFNVPSKDSNDAIFSEGGRLIGEMCHHVDLALYLLGMPCQVSYSDNQIELKDSKNENSSILMSFPNNSSAFIRYSTMGDSQGIKEKIKLSFDNRTLEVTNFETTKLKANNSSKVVLKKFDKGFHDTWKKIENILKDNNLNKKELQKMKELDIATSKILLRAEL